MQIDPIAAQPRVHRHAFLSARSFDHDGLLAFNPDRFAIPASVCFAEGDGGAGDGGAGGSTGGAGGTGDAGKSGEKTISQAEFDARLAKARKSFEADAARSQAEATSKLQAELDEMRIKLEESGKTAAEKERLAAERARTAMETKNAEQAKLLTERDAELVLARTELRDTRVGHELNALLAARKVLPDMLEDALIVFRARTKLDFDDDGKIKGVDYGANGRYATLSEAVDAFMKDRGAFYLAAPAGGAGTKAGNAGAGNRALTEMSDDDLIKAANAARSTRR